MLYIKQLCLIIYIIITVLFTVGYASQPILETSKTVLEPTNQDGSTPTGNARFVSSSFYMGNITSILSNSQNTYSNGSNSQIIFLTLFFTCIGISIILVVGILLGFFGLKMISKLVFFIAMILMILIFVVIQIAILTNSLISNINMNGVNMDSIKSSKTSNGTGYYLIMAATALMIITYVVYVFLA
jgi:hypothetical protein